MINQVLQNLFRAVSLLVVSTALISVLLAKPTSTDALVKGWTPPEEQALSPEANGDNALGIVIRPSQDTQNEYIEREMEEKKTPDYPDFGSDQVFPFVAGLDSYQ